MLKVWEQQIRGEIKHESSFNQTYRYDQNTDNFLKILLLGA